MEPWLAKALVLDYWVRANEAALRMQCSDG
jgi:hypothetical protein